VARVLHQRFPGQDGQNTCNHSARDAGGKLAPKARRTILRQRHVQLPETAGIATTAGTQVAVDIYHDQAAPDISNNCVSDPFMPQMFSRRWMRVRLVGQ
jgi:hypothetical protein